MHTSASPPPTPAPPRRRGRRDRLLMLHEVRALLRTAGPIIVSQLGGVAMNTTDTIMVAPLGVVPLAAAGLGSAVQSFLMLVFTGVVMGSTPLVAQAFGGGNRRECRRILAQAHWVALALSVPFAAVLFAGETVTRVLGQPPEVSALAGDYMWGLAWGAWPVLAFMAFRQYLEGMGITTPAMTITFGALGLNVVANHALIHGVEGWVPALGVAGSAWATTAVRWTMLLAMTGYLLSRADLDPFRGSWRPAAARLRRIASVGLPIGVQNGAEVGIFALAAVMMGWIGAAAQAAHQVTINLAATTFMVALGVSIAGSIRVGQHVGAGRHRGVRRATVATYALALGFMTACALLFLAAPRSLIGLYTRDPQVLELGVALLFMGALFQIFDGAQVAGLAVLRGAADTRVPMLITLVGYWAVGVPVAYLLGFRTGMGPVGIWAGLVVSLGVVAFLLVFRVRRVLWRAAG